MCLLDVETKRLHTVEDEAALEYTILSHVWHKGEASYEDLQDLSQAKKKAGYAKIQFCCDEARKDGLKYVWIDTCCIEKTSSAELSEAINSMYRWYQNARVCYAYLRDVPENDRSHVQVANSQWFKRAWTLQELLASRNIQFHSCGWSFIGTRTDLQTVISETTSIDIELTYAYLT
jgi:hypothetical protein